MTQKQEVERPNWVQARADCTLEGTFEQLVNAITYDVRAFNTLPVHQRRGRTVRCVAPDINRLTVRLSGEGPTPLDQDISVYVSETNLKVYRHRECIFAVESQWNEQTLTCDLLIDGTPYSLWQISQKALGDLLFG